MVDESRHYVAYHNTERMGRTLSEGNPFGVLTNKPVERIHEGIVWLVAGEGRDPRRFSLGSVFRVTEMGNANEDGFKYFVSGPGHLFNPPVSLNELEWFDDFKRAMNKFQFGIQLINDEQHIAALTTIATGAGTALP